jgi:hypothetical protein
MPKPGGCMSSMQVQTGFDTKLDGLAFEFIGVRTFIFFHIYIYIYIYVNVYQLHALIYGLKFIVELNFFGN